MLADNQAAIQQRYAHWKMVEKEQDQAERAQKMKKVEAELQKENKWFKIAHVLIGVVIGIGLTTFYFSVPNTPKNLAPVVQNNE